MERPEGLMRRRSLYVIAACALAISQVPFELASAKPPATWDNLVRTPSKRLKVVYLKPGASFAQYHKIMLDPVQIAFDKDWRRNYNSGTRDPGRMIKQSDLEKAQTEGGKAATDIFAKTFAENGYPVVTTPGPDVLHLGVAIVDVRVAAPDTMSAGRSRTYSSEAGEATLFLEAKDSVSGTLLGRAADRQYAGDSGFPVMARSSVTNRSDFKRIVTSWAKSAVNGLNKLKTNPPAVGKQD
jgi:hypothetical protein